MLRRLALIFQKTNFSAYRLTRIWEEESAAKGPYLLDVVFPEVDCQLGSFGRMFCMFKLFVMVQLVDFLRGVS